MPIDKAIVLECAGCPYKKAKKCGILYDPRIQWEKGYCVFRKIREKQLDK